MFSMPGKINYERKFSIHIEVEPSTICIKYDEIVLHDCEQKEPTILFFEMPDDSKEHILSYTGSVSQIFVERIDVTNLISHNQLKFSTPIYRWLMYKG